MSRKSDAVLTDSDFKAAVASGEPIRSISKRFGVSYGFVQKARTAGSVETAGLASDELTGSSRNESSKGDITIEKRADRIIPLSEWLDDLRRDGYDPDDYNTSHGHSVWTQHTKDQVTKTLYANKFSAAKKTNAESGIPEWPLIQRAPLVTIGETVITDRVEVDTRYKVALKFADTQIGFRILPDGSLQSFHDEAAMAVAIKATHFYQPSKITILGDFLDLASQGRFAQEAAFARTTQLAIDAGHTWLAELRAAAPRAEIVIVEGNHDLRMQNFIEANALAAFGLKRANLPESWPVMSLPYLLRLEDLGIQYVDAYPAATDWDNDLTRNIHGTKANSKGSTMSQYVHDLPHVNTWAGHTHRAEIVYRTVLGARGEAVESYAANPGCLCRTDGAVPSVNGAIGVSGVTARVVEDWQTGFGVLYYNETESIPQVHRIRNGEALVEGRILRAS